MRKAKCVIQAIGFGLVIAAITTELRKPPADRTWHGKLAGLVPYDFRMPTLQRIRAAYWDRSNSSILTTRVVGVGWGLNLPSVISAIRKLRPAS